MQVDWSQTESRKNHGCIEYYNQCCCCHPDFINYKAGFRLTSLEKCLRQPGSTFGADQWARPSRKIKNRKHIIFSMVGLVIQGHISQGPPHTNTLKIRNRRFQHQYIIGYANLLVSHVQRQTIGAIITTEQETEPTDRQRQVHTEYCIQRHQGRNHLLKSS